MNKEVYLAKIVRVHIIWFLYEKFENISQKYIKLMWIM